MMERIHYAEVVSAGEYNVMTGDCSGKSESLNLKSNPHERLWWRNDRQFRLAYHNYKRSMSESFLDRFLQTQTVGVKPNGLFLSKIRHFIHAI